MCRPQVIGQPVAGVVRVEQTGRANLFHVLQAGKRQAFALPLDNVDENKPPSMAIIAMSANLPFSVSRSQRHRPRFLAARTITASRSCRWASATPRAWQG